MTILDIYNRYDIPPNLQEHQLTVAAVAQTVCDAQSDYMPTEDIVRVCLLHDMGNILKYKFDATAPGLALENVEHWKAVKERFKEAYGSDEHEATLAIARELGVSERMLALLDMMGFPHANSTLATGDRAAIIATYSDMRVSPTGVTTLRARLDNIRERYGSTPEGVERERAYEEMENLLFRDADAGPDTITEQSIIPVRDELRSYIL